MRIARLDLTRYGKFTGQSIDFGPRRPDAPDFHIIYGPNESGKSTTLAAWLDLLFGIGADLRRGEKRKSYNFLHADASLTIGATLELQTGMREFVRTKRSLLDGAGRPLAEGALSGELGGLDRAAYQAMFSLDDETIESGGDSILQSKGELGEMLFSASAGLPDLSRRLAAVRDEGTGFASQERLTPTEVAEERLLAGLRWRARGGTVRSEP